MLTVGNAGSIIGNVTVNGGGFTNNGTVGGNGLTHRQAGGSFVNNGTVNTPLQWQVNQGAFTNNNAFNGSLANTGTAANNGTLTGSVINTAAGTVSNTGTITGSATKWALHQQRHDRRQLRQHGRAERHGTIGRQPRPTAAWSRPATRSAR